MDIRKVKKLMEMLEDSSLEEMEIIEGEESIRLSKSSNVESFNISNQVPQNVINKNLNNISNSNSAPVKASCISLKNATCLFSSILSLLCFCLRFVLLLFDLLNSASILATKMSGLSGFVKKSSAPNFNKLTSLTSSSHAVNTSIGP